MRMSLDKFLEETGAELMWGCSCFSNVVYASLPATATKIWDCGWLTLSPKGDGLPRQVIVEEPPMSSGRRLS